MIRLYKSMEHPGQWIAYAPESGWLVFPNREHGWEDRKPARGLDPIHLREVAPALGAQAGLTLAAPAPAPSLPAPAPRFKKVA